MPACCRVAQGLLVKTAKYGWRTAWQTLMTELAPQSKDGTYQRPSYSFQGRVGSPEFPLEPGRYHLYVGNACPWCHRVLLALVVSGLEGHIRWVAGVPAVCGAHGVYAVWRDAACAGARGIQLGVDGGLAEGAASEPASS